MGGYQEADPAKEKKRQKALRRMGKLVSKAWELPGAECFQAGQLQRIGERLDASAYKYGRHGWEDFARDIGEVYQRHLMRKTKHAKIAQEHLEKVASWLGEKDESLANIARTAIPAESGKKRRKSEDDESIQSKKKKKDNHNSKSAASTTISNITLGEREERAMENLTNYIQEQGGDARMVVNYTCRVTRKPSDGRYDTNYYNEQGRRFRSMIEVGKFLNVVTGPARSAGGKKAANMKKRKASSKEVESEKKRLRKELEKLRRQHTKARKQLDDFLTDEKDTIYPIEDTFLQEAGDDGTSPRKILPTHCPTARIPDTDSFPGLPQHVMPEVLAVWDFLSTFSRSLNVNPVPLQDFIQCLTYQPPPNLSDSDAFKTPPVFLGEAHLGLLKLILADPSSDEWWWSILETDVTENAVAADVTDGVENGEESELPLIKIDFAALLLAKEDPLITQSWLTNLEKVRNLNAGSGAEDTKAIRDAIRSAMGVAANKWILAFLRKALKLGKTSGTSFMKQSVVWLCDKFKEASPDLNSRSVNTKLVMEKRAKVVETVTQQMDKLSAAALAVTENDLVSDVEDESDEESDEEDSDDEEDNPTKTDDSAITREDPDERPASYIPKKPPPSLVDLLLPPAKPIPPSDLLNPINWPEMAGAAATRIMHRYKRLRNELDDSLRLIRELPHLTVKQRRERELIASQRIFSEFAHSTVPGEDPPQQAADHLCAGGNYLDLTPLQRLCIIRVLIDAAYDTTRLHQIIDSNHKQRTNAVKALDIEQRRAKKEAKENAAAAEAIARDDLALEAKRKFIEEKREEIRDINKANEELTQEEIDELTEEDILDFDDDIRADFEALPAPESFKKMEVVARVEQIKEAAAFETDVLTVLTMEELLEKETNEIETLEENLRQLGGEEALLYPELDRSEVRKIEKTRRDLNRARANAESLPIQRETAIETLQEAIADGTIKSLRAAIRIAKTARLFGPDEYTNGVWTLDVVRDAHIELENAKQLKRVADAQQDLVSKLARCFTRTEPLGSDRYRNRLWKFENTEQIEVWAEVNLVLKEANPGLSNEHGYLPVVSDLPQILVCAADMEEDFGRRDKQDAELFSRFSRQEYHPTGLCASLAQHRWGCHSTEVSVRALMKGLDGRGIRENGLKNNLKDALEKATAAENSVIEETKAAHVEVEETKSGEGEDEENGIQVEEKESESKEQSIKAFKASGDEEAFANAKSCTHSMESDIIERGLVVSLSSGIGQRIRVRFVVESGRESEVARYEDAMVTGWKIRQDRVPIPSDEGAEFDPAMQTVDVPIWHGLTGNGKEIWLTGKELLESVCRYQRHHNRDPTYFESDAAFLAYRNSSGRHCGKAAEAAHALTPMRLAQAMVRREAEIYQRLKHIVYESSWGGRDGNRNAWMTSMKDYAFDLEAVREGLLTLENGLLEMTGGMPSGDAPLPSGKELLSHPTTRDDIELESIEKGVKSLWNSAESRAVFVEIIRNCKSVGFLSLGLELLTRNAFAYIDANIPSTSGSKAGSLAADPGNYELLGTSRSTRRSSNKHPTMSSWSNDSSSSYYYYDDPIPVSRPRRAARVDYGGLD